LKQASERMDHQRGVNASDRPHTEAELLTLKRRKPRCLVIQEVENLDISGRGGQGLAEVHFPSLKSDGLPCWQKKKLRGRRGGAIGRRGQISSKRN